MPSLQGGHCLALVGGDSLVCVCVSISSYASPRFIFLPSFSFPLIFSLSSSFLHLRVVNNPFSCRSSPIFFLSSYFSSSSCYFFYSLSSYHSNLPLSLLFSLCLLLLLLLLFVTLFIVLSSAHLRPLSQSGSQRLISPPSWTPGGRHPFLRACDTLPRVFSPC